VRPAIDWQAQALNKLLGPGKETLAVFLDLVANFMCASLSACFIPSYAK
jgi:hypothetical protein